MYAYPRRLGLLATSATAIASLLSQSAAAAIFPDVPDTDPHKANIEWLVGLQVIGGNPDGTFKPNKEVNRAELLAMIYRAIGRKPATAPTHQFRDVEIGSWYQLIVDDAAMQGYVQGYSDGTFRPGQFVNRVEALKMIMSVMALDVPEITTDSRDIVRFGDVYLGSWYVKYLSFAYASGILPIPDQDGNLFHPERALLRKEAASYIANALRFTIGADQPASSASSTPRTRSAASQASSAPAVSIKEVGVPFAEASEFSGRQPKLYRFTLGETKTVRLTAQLNENNGGVVCRLYRIENDGYAYEYYVGYRESMSCSMLVTLTNGDYQLELQSAEGGGDYSVSGEISTGDKQDGFSQAVPLQIDKPRVGILDVGDYMDFYTFTVTGETNLRVEVSATAQLGCSVWPMENVELESFSGPQCNTDYDFPAGTYVIGVGHAISGKVKQTYTLRLK